MYKENPETYKKYWKKRHQERKSCGKVGNFLRQIKQGPERISAYWKKFLYDVLATIKHQLRIHTSFLPLSYANQRWEELPYISKELNNLHLHKFLYKNTDIHSNNIPEALLRLDENNEPINKLLDDLGQKMIINEY